MPFDYADLDAPEIAALALEYLTYTAMWMEEAADEETIGDEPSRVLSDAARSIRALQADLEVQAREHYGEGVPEGAGLSARLRRKPSLVSYDEPGPEVGAGDILEVACAEQEEAYQFFVEEAGEVEDPWLRALFVELGEHARGVVLLLEGERESIADNEG